MPHGWRGWGMSLPSNGGRGGQDVGLRGPVSHWGVRQRPCNPLMYPRTPGTYMVPCSGAAGKAGLCQGAPLGVLAPALALEHRWHHRPHGYRLCGSRPDGSTGPTAPSPAALLTLELPALQAVLLGGTLAMGVPRGGPGRRPVAGCNVQILSALCIIWAARQLADLRQPPFPSLSCQQCHAQSGDGGNGSSFHPAPSPQLSSAEKKSTSWLAVSKTPAFRGSAAPLYPWTS